MNLQKIGVLLPHSKQHPTMSKEFMNGLRLSLPSSEYNFSIEGIGFGENPEHVINAAQKLINQEEVSVTTGILGHRGLKDIVDFFEEMDQSLIYADMGATKPLDIASKKNSFCNSLDLYGATYSLGKHFIKNDFKNIATSTCYYESGYGFTEAMQNSLYEYEQGEFSGHFITPLHPRENETELMVEFISETKPDILFAFHNGIYAKEHASFLEHNKLNSKIPMYTLPFSLDEIVLSSFPKILEGIKCISSWFLELNTEENKKFIKEYQQKYNKTPSIFSVLGYENGLLIHQYLKNKKTFPNEQQIGPRGNLNNFKNTNRTKPKQYIWELEWVNNTYTFNCLEKLNQEINIPFLNDEGGNGWHNAYLCH